MNPNQNGSKSYLISIVMVAVLGGLLFGYDTAVIRSGERIAGFLPRSIGFPVLRLLSWLHFQLGPDRLYHRKCTVRTLGNKPRSQEIAYPRRRLVLRFGLRKHESGVPFL